MENIASALLYGSLLSSHLEELARARAGKSTEVADFAQMLSVEQTRFKLQAVAQASNPIQPGKEKEQKDPLKGKPSVPKADWLPRAEYKAKMAAERAAAAAKAKAVADAATSAARPPADRQPDRQRSHRRSRSRRDRSRSRQRPSPKDQPMRRRRR